MEQHDKETPAQHIFYNISLIQSSPSTISISLASASTKHLLHAPTSPSGPMYKYWISSRFISLPHLQHFISGIILPPRTYRQYNALIRLEISLFFLRISLLKRGRDFSIDYNKNCIFLSKTF